ncbi:MAG TPA: TldD/PmbA family protein [Acidimicrobiales bacterium]|nr:TldD/PmbA family protein [Acidimicrobiales bacterium]
MNDVAGIAALVVSWAHPGEDVEAYVSRSRTTNVRAYNGDVESLSSAEPAGAGVRVVVGGRQGFAWAGTLDEGVLKEALEEARDNAAFGQPDEFAGLATPDGVALPVLDLVPSELAATPTSAKVELALELERATRARDARVTGIRAATYADSYGEVAVATTTGISAVGAAAMCYIAVSPIVEADGDTQIGSGLSAARAPSGLDLDRAVTDGVDRAVRLLGARKPPSRRVTAVFDPDVTAEFLAILGGTLSGDAVLKGRSFFAGREGERVASAAVTLVSDPTDAGSFDAGQIDGEGLARRRVPLIEGGHLQGFLYDTASGRRAGRASTGSASRGYSSAPTVGAPALTLAPGTRSRAELLASLDDGVCVQDVSGLHSGVNPVSGDFSVGATGLAVRNGALAEPFREATIASTLQRMLLDVAEVGADIEWLPGGPAGVTLVVHDVSLGGA